MRKTFRVSFELLCIEYNILAFAARSSLNCWSHGTNLDATKVVLIKGYVIYETRDCDF